MKDVDLGEPTSFLDHVYLGLHSERKSKKQRYIVGNYKDMFSAGAKEKLPTRASWKADADTRSSWSYDMESHTKKCVDSYCELMNETTQPLHKVATPCLDDTI